MLRINVRATSNETKRKKKTERRRNERHHTLRTETKNQLNVAGATSTILILYTYAREKERCDRESHLLSRSISPSVKSMFEKECCVKFNTENKSNEEIKNITMSLCVCVSVVKTYCSRTTILCSVF